METCDFMMMLIAIIGLMHPYEWAMVILTAIGLVGLFVYVIKTANIATSTRKQAEILNRPAITIQIFPNITEIFQTDWPAHAHIATFVKNHTTIHANLKITIMCRLKKVDKDEFEEFFAKGSYGGQEWHFAAKGKFQGHFKFDGLKDRTIVDGDELVMDITVESSPFNQHMYLSNPRLQYKWKVSSQKWVPYPVPED